MVDDREGMDFVFEEVFGEAFLFLQCDFDDFKRCHDGECFDDAGSHSSPESSHV